MNNLFSRQRFLLIALTLALIGGGMFYLRSTAQPPRDREEGIAQSDAVAASTPSTPPVPPRANVRSVANPPPRLRTVSSSSQDDEPSILIVSDRPRFVAAAPPAQRRAGQDDPQLQTASVSLRDYRQAFKQNPVGTNAEITRALSGKNSRGQRYLPADARLNDKGELSDRWDQPLFFHQVSGTLMEIRSAGPDHVMWTADDEVVR